MGPMSELLTTRPDGTVEEATPAEAARYHAVVDQLDAYNGDNIREDVIRRLPDYDGQATEALDPDRFVAYYSDAFVAAGIVYQYDPFRGLWA
jgi:hypothetical protein